MRFAFLVLVVLLSTRASVQQSTSGAVRLRGGALPGEGRVEVFHSGRWGSVCDDRWDQYDARVVCRMLGYSDALEAVFSGRMGSMSDVAPIWMDNVHCRGDEESIFDCIQNQLGRHDCDHSEDAGVKCSVPIPVKVDRLPVRVFCPPANNDSNGNVTAGSCKDCGNTMLRDQNDCVSNAEVEGFPQAFYDGEWHFIDGSRWGDKESFVFCGQLGYPASFPQPSLGDLLGCTNLSDSECFPSVWRDKLNSPIMYLLRCQGHEASLQHCYFASWYYAPWVKWKAGKYATVSCGFGPGQHCPSAGQTPLRLAASPFPGIGRVEVHTGSTWGTICGRGFGYNDANVICRQMGFGTARLAFDKNVHGMGTGPVKMQSLQCRGDESGLRNCIYEKGDRGCSHLDDIAVECTLPTTCAQNEKESKSQLHDEVVLDSQYHYVRYRRDSFLEVQVNGEWGLVCYAYQNSLAQAGQVVCREQRKLFYSGHRNGDATHHTGPRFYGRMKCKGDELSSENCSMQFVKVVSCGSLKETIIDCSASLPDMVPSIHSLRSSMRTEYVSTSRLECALEEGCIPRRARRSSFRRLLRFDSFVVNLGSADFIPYEDRSKWDYHVCHQHYHSHEQFASYELFNLNGSQATEGQKASFCLEDTECIYGAPKYSCSGGGHQGISSGCGDKYAAHLDCQWLDITDVPIFKEYELRITANPSRNPTESDYSNNVVTCRVYIHAGSRIQVQSPPGCWLSG